MIPYVEACRRRDVYLSRIARHMLGLYAGIPGARAWLLEHRLVTPEYRPTFRLRTR